MLCEKNKRAGKRETPRYVSPAQSHIIFSASASGFRTTDLWAYLAINQNFNKQFAESPKTRNNKRPAGEITCKIVEFAATRGNVNKKN